MRYVPILRAKQGEFEALFNLSSSVKSSIIPLLQILPDTNAGRKGDYLKGLSNSIIKKWDGLFYIDFSYYGTSQIGTISNFLQVLKAKGCRFIPVFSANENPAYVQFISSNGYTDNGLLVRVKQTGFSNMFISNQTSQYSSALNIENSDIDLLLDFEHITSSNVYAMSSLPTILPLIQRLGLRNIIIGSGSFPENVSHLRVDTVTNLDRHEEAIWRAIHASFPNIKYADYGNINPIPSSTQPFEGSCSIKYSTRRTFTIFRGGVSSTHPRGHDQYRDKSLQLINDAVYSGNGFSWGDNFINNCANGLGGTGNAGTWVGLTMNHHITLIESLL